MANNGDTCPIADEQAAMKQQPNRNSSKAANIWPLAAVLLMLLFAPVFYVLSIGPVVAMVQQTGQSHDAVEAIYAPVIWLHDHTPLKEPLERYGELWGWK
jgi:hypothetical protein